MKAYNALSELRADVVDDELIVGDSVRINFNLDMPKLSIDVWNLETWHINVKSIKSLNIHAGGDMNVSGDIEAGGNIEAYNIHAENISYNTFCIAYQSIVCKSIKGKRMNSFHKCLDYKLIIIDKSKHTPTPWVVKKSGGFNTGIYGANNRWIGTLSINEKRQGEVDAEYLVTCVNSHEKLLEDNKIMREALEAIAKCKENE